ncbi:MAG: hypothetical protein Q9M31_01280 [Mariprofundus sp.]|nr:hypothetical protein [Mariprofundus sp.]
MPDLIQNSDMVLFVVKNILALLLIGIVVYSQDGNIHSGNLLKIAVKPVTQTDILNVNKESGESIKILGSGYQSLYSLN